MTIPPATLAILRSLEGLTVLNVHLCVSDKGYAYEEQRTVLPANQENAALADAWEKLASVREIEPQVLAAVQLVLRETVIDLDADRPQLASLDIAPPPRAYKPTAANPRAYKGTHDRPPKPRRPELMDLRPFLCVTGGQDRLLALLSRELGPVELPHEARGETPKFRRYFEAVCRRADSGSSAKAAYHQLGLEANSELRRAVAFMFAKCPEEMGAWCEFLVGIESERRLTSLGLLLETGTLGQNPKSELAHLLCANQLTSESQFPNRMHYALSRFAHDESELSRVLFSFRLLDEHYPRAEFKAESPPPSEEDAQTLAEFASRYDFDEGWQVQSLVDLCGKSDQFASVLRAILSSSLNSASATKLARVLGQAAEDADPRAAWRNVHRFLNQCIVELQKLPHSHTDQGLELIWQCMWIDKTERLDFVLALFPILCEESFPVGGSVDLPVLEFAFLNEDQRAEILKAPKSSFEVFSDRAWRKNDGRLIARGIESLVSECPALLVEAFTSSPAFFVRVSRTLGLLSWATREVLIKEAKQALPFEDTGRVGSMEPSALIELIDEHCGSEAKSQVPRVLRAHVLGEPKLRPGQVDRHLKKLQYAWPSVCCSAIHKLALQRLNNGLIDTEKTDFGELSDQISHALRLQVGAEDNRRSLRRLIRECYAGNSSFLEEHPRNQAWVASHPGFPLRAWIRGIEITRKLTADRLVTLSLEQDPLEALRLGTYVGSCLGLGGKFTWSAAATVLDINKQVVFARDANGRFLARQILGVTNSGKLACYGVYPKVDSELQILFRDYDLEFARQLGIGILVEPDDPTDEEREACSVSPTLAQDWWDDGIWDHEIEE